jgi:hypothetical protein
MMRRDILLLQINHEHLRSRRRDQKMANSFKTLRDLMTPEAQAVAREKTASMMKDMSLHELPNARELTQGSLAEQLDLGQPSETLTPTFERDER